MEEADGPLVFVHACKLGLEGIVSKRKDSHARWPSRWAAI
jgi:ATP-dependent DNA ligase